MILLSLILYFYSPHPTHSLTYLSHSFSYLSIPLIISLHLLSTSPFHSRSYSVSTWNPLKLPYSFFTPLINSHSCIQARVSSTQVSRELSLCYILNISEYTKTSYKGMRLSLDRGRHYG